MNKPLTGHLLAFLTVLIWGTTFIATKLLLITYTPIEILFLRFIIGFTALWIACPRPLKLLERRHELYFAGAGLCGVTLYFLMENIALTHTLASSVGIIVSISPFFTAILAHFFLNGERLRVRFFVGFVVALAGILLIGYNGSQILQLNPLGDVLAVGAAAVWAVYSMLIRKVSRYEYNIIQTTRRTFFYGLVFMLPALPLMGFRPDFEALLAPDTLFNMLFLGLGASALCFSTWNSAVKILGAVTTSTYIYLVPVATVVTSLLILNEPVNAVTIVGTVLALAGLFISENRLAKKEYDTACQSAKLSGDGFSAYDAPSSLDKTDAKNYPREII